MSGQERAVGISGRLQVKAEQTGRAAEAPRVSVLQTVCCGKGEPQVTARAAGLGGRRRPESFAGTPDRIVDLVGRYVDAGVARVHLRVLDLEERATGTGSEVLPQLPERRCSAA
ncbi:hypothetical protein ABZT02_41920 [Streptomyces sp. NPDC005402]|uniref:hypothetical protein n=1 Tax=Streptomyces sp. NPDC005402 TaxID=3155338 RepID=UPI0033ACE1C2